MKILIPIIVLIFITCSGFTLTLKTVHILHTNDIHSHYEKLPALYQTIQQLRQENSVLVDSGDVIDETSLTCIKTNGKFAMKVLNELNYDLFTLGNNEFNFGITNLEKALTNLKVPLICGNLFHSKTGELFTKPWKIIEKNGIRMGFIGALSDMKKYFYQPLTDPYYTINNENELISLYQIYCNQLKENKCDLIILLSHLGNKQDEQIARSIPDISLIIGGHSHSEISWKKIRNTSIVQAGEYAEKIGETEILWDTENKKVLLIKNKLHPINATNEKLPFNLSALYQQFLSDEIQLKQVIGKFPYDLSRKKGNQDVLPHLITSIMKKETHSDFFFHNLRSVRTNIPSGEFRLRDLMNIFYYNYVCYFELSGKQLLEILQKMPELPENDTLIVSGFKSIKWNKTSSGYRCVETIPEINQEKIYHCAGSAWVAYNSQKYFKLSLPNIRPEISQRLREIFSNSILKNIPEKPILPVYEISYSKNGI